MKLPCEKKSYRISFQKQHSKTLQSTGVPQQTRCTQTKHLKPFEKKDVYQCYLVSKSFYDKPDQAIGCGDEHTVVRKSMKSLCLLQKT